MKKLIENVKHKAKTHFDKIKSTTTDLHTLKTNVFNKTIVEALESLLKNLEKHNNYIGKYVYKYKNNFSFSETIIASGLNRTEDHTILFTEEYVATFLFEYNAFLKRYYTDLIINNLYDVSEVRTQWKLQAYKEFLDILEDLNLEQCK